jgi:hypothetical protein
MPKSRLSQLTDAMTEGSFVRIARRFEDSPIRGYVIALGPKFFLLALVNDRLWFDGFECFRVADVLRVRPDPYAAFAEAALKKRGERKPRKPRIDLDSVETLLRSVGQAFPLVTIHREKAIPDVCHIGRVVKVFRGRLSLLEIRPNASWEDRPTEYRLADITRVNFGGDYEEALHIVGGDAAG